MTVFVFTVLIDPYEQKDNIDMHFQLRRVPACLDTLWYHYSILCKRPLYLLTDYVVIVTLTELDCCMESIGLSA